jgi:acyl-CoA thioesterase FadM
MTVEGSANFGSAFEGPPACVHGGFVAAAFDEVLGYVNSLTGSPGMTARLIVDYKRPTPLHTDLTFRAQLDRVDGRKIYASGQVIADDVITASADALFVSVSADKLADLYMASQEREEARLDASNESLRESQDLDD